MISVYDGQRIGIGRVVVDSTWHHWMGMNINAIESAALAQGASAEAVANWEKIREYFVNIAVWLATASQRRCMARWYLTTAHFGYVGAEELRPGRPIPELGRSLAAYLRPILGPCWVRSFVLDLMAELHPKLLEVVLPAYLGPGFGGRPEPGPACLSCPPWDLLEAHVLGGVAQASITVHAGAIDQLMAQRPVELPSGDGDDARMLLDGARDGLRAFEQALRTDLERLQPWLTTLGALEAVRR
jgi:hypothetical protein